MVGILGKIFSEIISNYLIRNYLNLVDVVILT